MVQVNVRDPDMLDRPVQIFWSCISYDIAPNGPGTPCLGQYGVNYISTLEFSTPSAFATLSAARDYNIFSQAFAPNVLMTSTGVYNYDYNFNFTLVDLVSFNRSIVTLFFIII